MAGRDLFLFNFLSPCLTGYLWLPPVQECLRLASREKTGDWRGEWRSGSQLQVDIFQPRGLHSSHLSPLIFIMARTSRSGAQTGKLKPVNMRKIKSNDQLKASFKILNYVYFRFSRFPLMWLTECHVTKAYWADWTVNVLNKLVTDSGTNEWRLVLEMVYAIQ